MPPEAISATSIDIMLVILVVLLERFLPIGDSAHPLTLLAYLAKQLAHKVNPKDHRSDNHRVLAGVLAPIVLLVPLFAVLGVVGLMAEYAYGLELIALFIALRFRRTRRFAHRVQRALQGGQKQLARESMREVSLRDADSLSPMGIAKATVQSLLLRSWYQQFTTLVIFFIGGGLLALLYRCLYVCHQQWNPKLWHNRHFGKPLAHLMAWINLIPGYLLLALMLLATPNKPALNALVQTRGSVTRRLLAVAGSGLGLGLGGPAQYAGLKLRYARVGGKRPPMAVDIQRMQSTLDTMGTLVLLVLLLMAAISLL